MEKIMNISDINEKKLAVRRKYDPQDLQFFFEKESDDIERMARGLSAAEILDHWSVLFEDLPAADQAFFLFHSSRGRTMGKTFAIDKLFNQMQTQKSGKDAALAYLLRFSPVWDAELEDKVAGKTYKLIME